MKRRLKQSIIETIFRDCLPIKQIIHVFGLGINFSFHFIIWQIYWQKDVVVIEVNWSPRKVWYRPTAIRFQIECVMYVRAIDDMKIVGLSNRCLRLVWSHSSTRRTNKQQISMIVCCCAASVKVGGAVC